MRWILLTGLMLTALLTGCGRNLHRDVNRELDEMNREARESKEPVEAGGPLRESREFQ